MRCVVADETAGVEVDEDGSPPPPSGPPPPIPSRPPRRAPEDKVFVETRNDSAFEEVSFV